MKDRLAGGDRLAALHRCEMHTWWGEPAGVDMARVLDTGRYFNPNKHHYGHFAAEGSPWGAPTGGALDAAWPGALVATDVEELGGDAAGLYARLLGGPVPAGHTAVDVAAWSRDQEGPVFSGVLWRLVVSGGPADAARVGEGLAVARTRKEGLLINPHMEAWLSRAG
jgi:hypothetical protein